MADQKMVDEWLRVPVDSFTVGAISVGRGFGHDAGIVVEMTGPMEIDDVEARALASALCHASREFRLERRGEASDD